MIRAFSSSQSAKMTNTAWAFCVVSSGRQEDTLVDQESWMRTHAAANGWEITRVFSDVSTGKAGVRKSLARLIDELRATAKADRPDRILMLRLDRVGRGKLADSLVALRELEELGCIAHTRDGGDEIVDEPVKELLAAVKFLAASEENRVRREKSSAFHARKKAAGEYASRPPYGFVFVDKRLAPYEPEATVVRQLFQKRVSGFGYQRLAQLAAAIGPAKIRPNGKFSKFSWSENTITSILRNERYRGPIVTEALWDEVAAMRGTLVERRATRWPWPLRGAVRCTCGAGLLGEASGRPTSRTRYYVCRRFNHHENPSHPHHHAAAMEAQFVALLRRLEPTGDLQPYARPQADLGALQARRTALTRERSDLEARRSRAWALAEDGAINKGDLAARLEDFHRDSERISESLRSVERELAGAESRDRISADVTAAFAGLPEIWPQLEVQAQRDVARVIAACVGGLWADPKQPGLLLFGPKITDDGSPKNVDTLRNVDMAQRKMDAFRTIATRRGLVSVARRIRSNTEKSAASDHSPRRHGAGSECNG